MSMARMDDKVQASRGTIQSVDRSLQLLWALDRPEGQSLSVLAARVGLLPTTAGRLLATLERYQLVERDRISRRYRLGMGISELNRRLPRQEDLAIRLRPVVSRLAETVQEMVEVVVLDSDSVLHVLAVDGAVVHDLVVRSKEGLRERNLHATAVGKVLLAFAAPALRDHLLAALALEAYTSQTITTRVALRAQLALVREQGYAFSLGEVNLDVRGMAAPIFDRDGVTIAALAIHGPATRFSEEQMQKWLPLLRQSATDASLLLGYDPAD